jgi:hypothetical protein
MEGRAKKLRPHLGTTSDHPKYINLKYTLMTQMDMEV